MSATFKVINELFGAKLHYQQLSPTAMQSVFTEYKNSAALESTRDTIAHNNIRTQNSTKTQDYTWSEQEVILSAVVAVAIL